MEIYNPSKLIYVSSNKNKYSLRINDEIYRIIPIKYDIIGLYIEELPEYIKNIELHIGGYKILNLDISKKNILEDLPIFLSKIKYYYVDFVFEIDKEYLEKNETFKYVDEYIVKEEYSDNEYDFYDGDEIRKGRRVYYKNISTGNKVKEIYDFELILPSIKIQLIEGDNDENIKKTYFYETVLVYPTSIKYFLENYELQPIGLTIDEAIKNDKQFYGRVRNYIYYSSGMAQKAIVF